VPEEWSSNIGEEMDKKEQNKDKGWGKLLRKHADKDMRHSGDRQRETKSEDFSLFKVKKI